MSDLVTDYGSIIRRGEEAKAATERAEFELLVNTATRIMSGWLASGRNMNAKEAIAEAAKVIDEAKRHRGQA